MISHPNGGEVSWIKSPVTLKKEQLKPMRILALDPYQGRRRQIKIFRTRYLIGSSPDCDIKIDDPYVSPAHAELVIREGDYGYQVVDLESRNGTFLNGVKVQSAPLPDNGQLRVGRSTLAWRSEEETSSQIGSWIVADPVMKETVDRVKQLAQSDLPVLLLGETGTGKEFLARLIHETSPRRSYPYVAVNGALTGGPLSQSELFGHKKGAFTGADSHRMGAMRSAHLGTLFLDEVADIPPGAQVKLLRAIESGEVTPLGSDRPEKAEFRLVAATSRPMEELVRDGSFRLDLYYRIAGCVLRVPPLRERPLDILGIAEKLFHDSGLELHEESKGKLLSYSWPGNVRELRSCVGRAILSARAARVVAVLPHHLDGLARFVEPVKARSGYTLEDLEREYIKASLERNAWSRGATAKELGIARSTLFEKMRKFGIRDKA